MFRLLNQYNGWSELPSLIERGESENEYLVKGEEAFLNKEYAIAKQQFENVASEGANFNANTSLYLGISYLELNEYKSALLTFDKLINSESLDASKGHWYKGLTYLKMNKKDDAKEQFEILAKHKGYYNHETAKSILKQLEP